MTVPTLISCDCSGALWVPHHQASKVCTNLSIASFPVFFPWSSRTAVTTDCCRNLDTRLWVQYSFLHCQIGLDKQGQSDDASRFGISSKLTLHSRWALAQDSWTTYAPPPWNCPPSIFGVWAASTRGHLPGTTRVYVKFEPEWVLPPAPD